MEKIHSSGGEGSERRGWAEQGQESRALTAKGRMKRRDREHKFSTKIKMLRTRLIEVPRELEE